MKNTVTKAFIGETFIDWVRNNYDVATQNDKFFSLFDRVCKKDNVDLYLNNEDTLTIILNKNKNKVTYCEDITPDTNYLCEDSCHKLHGFNALTDIGFPYLWAETMGTTLMYMYEDYEKKDLDTKNWMIDFATYLSPKIMNRLVEMTKIFMGEEGNRISDNTIQLIWGDESSMPLCKWISSFNNLILYDDAENYIADYLDFNVIHVAIGVVEGNDHLSDDKYCELHDYVSCSNWATILKLWSEDSASVEEARKDLKLNTQKEWSIDETIADIHWTKELAEFPKVTEYWWKVGTFTEGELWMNNCEGYEILYMPNGRILLADF